MSNQRTYYVDGLQRKDEYDRNCAVKPGMMVSSTYLPQVRVVALRTRARASLVVKSQHDWNNLDVRGYWAFSILGPLYGTPAVPGQEFWPGRDDMRHQTYNIYLYNTPTYRRYLGSGHSAGRISASCSRCSADQVTAITQRHGVANATEKSSLRNSLCTEMITLFVEHQLFTNRLIIEHWSSEKVITRNTIRYHVMSFRSLWMTTIFLLHCNIFKMRERDIILHNIKMVSVSAFENGTLASVVCVCVL